jgi:predicted nucleic-acid-binding protein
MTSLDTNVVVRLIVGDDVRQARAAENLVASRPCRVAATVLMECEWVLRASYDLDAPAIAAAFRGLLDLENIEASDPAITARTLMAYEAGVDFADALHAVQCTDGEEFATFDKALGRRAASAGLRGIVLLKA